MRAGTLPQGADARYLLGIVRNLHAQREANYLIEALIRARFAARDTYLLPLIHQRDTIRALPDHRDALHRLTDLAAAADRTIDRHFWIDAIADFLSQRPSHEHAELFRSTARRVHASFRTPREHRDTITRALANYLWPVA